MSQEEGAFIRLHRLGTLNQGPWRFAHLFRANHMLLPSLPSPRTCGVSNDQRIIRLLEYPRELWTVQGGESSSPCAATTASQLMKESEEASSGDALSGSCGGDVVIINTLLQSRSEHEKTEELHMTLDPNFEASRISDLPIATLSSAITELT